MTAWRHWLCIAKHKNINPKLFYQVAINFIQQNFSLTDIVSALNFAENFWKGILWELTLVVRCLLVKMGYQLYSHEIKAQARQNLLMHTVNSLA